MSFPLALSPRDAAALELATASGALTVPTVDSLSELTPERAVMIGLARHLARLEARVEAGAAGAETRLTFRFVRDEWPQGQEPAQYPSATLLPQTSTEWDAITGVPVVGADGLDVISADDAWGLWRLGEDVGVGVVHVFALFESHRNALVNAVEQALFGDLDRLQALALPLPEILYPPPFRGLFEPSAFHKARVAFKTGGGPVDDDEAGVGGVWRGDVYFTWQAPRFAARQRLFDLRTETTVRVGPAGEEIPLWDSHAALAPCPRSPSCSL